MNNKEIKNVIKPIPDKEKNILVPTLSTTGSTPEFSVSTSSSSTEPLLQNSNQKYIDSVGEVESTKETQHRRENLKSTEETKEFVGDVESQTELRRKNNRLVGNSTKETKDFVSYQQTPYPQNPLSQNLASPSSSTPPLLQIKLLNQGAFGCVYKPYIKCDGNIGDKRYVTKIQLDNENIKNELIISEKIKTIPNFQYFFAPLLKTCNVSLSSINEEERDKCNLINDKSKITNKKFLSAKIRFVGNKNIEQYLLSILIIEYLKYIQNKDLLTNLKDEKKLKLYIKSKTYLQSLDVFTPLITNSKEKISYFFFENIMTKKITSSYYYLLKAIQKIQNYNIIHFDIKESNILYDENNHSPIIIDFGISFDLTTPPTPQKMEEFFYTDKFYIYWCIDIFIINYIINKVRKKDKITSGIISQNDVNIILLEFFTGLKQFIGSIETIKQDIIEYESKIQLFLNSFIGKDWEELLVFLFKKELYSSWDNYSLAITYIFISNSVHFIEYNTVNSSKLIKLWKSIVFSIPGERKNIDKTIEEWNNIISFVFDSQTNL